MFLMHDVDEKTNYPSNPIFVFREKRERERERVIRGNSILAIWQHLSIFLYSTIGNSMNIHNYTIDGTQLIVAFLLQKKQFCRGEQLSKYLRLNTLEYRECQQEITNCLFQIIAFAVEHFDCAAYQKLSVIVHMMDLQGNSHTTMALFIRICSYIFLIQFRSSRLVY